MAINYVNSASPIIGDSGTPTSFAATSLTAGNLIAVSVRWSGAVTLNSITDTAGNTYAQVDTQVITGSDHMSLWYAQGVTGNGSNVVTLNFSAAPGGGSIYAVTAQYSGLATSSTLDTSVKGTHATGPVTSPSFSTAQAEELIVSTASVSAGNGATLTPSGTSGSYNKRTTSIVGGLDITSLADYIASSVQSGATATWSDSASDNIGIIVATFKAPAAGETITLDKWGNHSSELFSRRLKGAVASGTIAIKN
jgi:hypothetical protein